MVTGCTAGTHRRPIRHRMSVEIPADHCATGLSGVLHLRRDGTDLGFGTPGAPRQRFGATLSVLACIALIAAASATVRHGRLISTMLGGASDRAFAALGFGIDEIIIVGHRHTLDADVFAALRAEGSDSLIRFDAADARQRVELLPWVDTARISRSLPNSLKIELTERRATAVWRSGESHVLVDATGRSLAHVSASLASDLPRISGARAPETAAALFDALALHPGIGMRVVAAHRVGERRWSLDLTDGSRVHLPEHGLDAALQQLADLEASGAATGGPKIIDLRRGNSLVAIRSQSPASATPPEAAGRSQRNM